MFARKICLGLLSMITSVCVGYSLQAEEQGGIKLRFSLAGESKDAPVTVVVSGKVRDKGTNQPIPNASVRGNLVIWKYQGPDLFDRCPYQETTANQAGEYTLKFVTLLTTTGPMQGKDGLCVYAGAPAHETRPIFAKRHVTPKSLDYRIDFALDKGRQILGVVVDEDRKPVAGARVRIQNSSSGVWTFYDSLGRTTTDEDGRFQLGYSTEGELITDNPWLQVFKSGYGAGFYFDILKKDDMGMLVLPKGGEIRGRVVDSAGKGVENCEVYATTWFVQPVVSVRTDADGRYVLCGVPGEPSIVSFYKSKNRSYRRPWGEIALYARTDPALGLSDVPSCKVMAQDGKTVAAPDFVIGDSHSVSGRLIPSKSTLVGLKGLLVGLDDGIDRMPEVDADGKFYFPFISPGKHRLFAYLPTNAGNKWGIGRTEIEVPQQKKLEGVEIPLDDLAEARIQFLDAGGNPVEGILAGSSFTRDWIARPDGPGVKTLGTRSDADGRAVIYLYIFPFGPQCLCGFDVEDRKLVSGSFIQVSPKPGEVLNNLRITMVPAAAIRGRVLDANGQPLPRKSLCCTLDYADRLREKSMIATDHTGRFELADLKPGVVRLWLETVPPGQVASVAKLTEIKPGEANDFGDLRLAVGKVPLPAGDYYRVTGKVQASPTFSDLGGFKIRIGWMEWEPMVTTDAQGRFTLEQVPAGKHRLTAYLPFNLRGDRGVGHVEIEVKDGDLEGVALPLDTLATVHMRIEDPQGRPLEGVSAAAWWTADHTGTWTEGSRSDKEGYATLFLYPGEQEQYIGGYDFNRRYVLRSHQKMTPKPGEVIKDITVIMQPEAE